MHPYAGPRDPYNGITPISEYYPNAFDPADPDSLMHKLSDEDFTLMLELIESGDYSKEQLNRILMSLLSGTDVNAFMAMNDESERNQAALKWYAYLFEQRRYHELENFLRTPLLNEPIKQANFSYGLTPVEIGAGAHAPSGGYTPARTARANNHRS